jgi:hypothetical protein
VWPLAGVDAHVSVELAAVLEGAAANVTLVGPLFGMDASVDLEVLLDAEHFMAELALEGPFAGMGAVVTDLEGRKIQNYRLFWLLIHLNVNSVDIYE